MQGQLVTTAAVGVPQFDELGPCFRRCVRRLRISAARALARARMFASEEPIDTETVGDHVDYEPLF
jgi:hypothetical protein